MEYKKRQFVVLKSSLEQNALIYDANNKTKKARDRIESLKKQYASLLDSINYLRKFSVDIGEKLIGLSSNIPQAARLQFLRPAFDINEKDPSWNLISIIKNDSVYSLKEPWDYTQFMWNDSYAIGKPKPGSGEPAVEAIQPKSKFGKLILNYLRKGNVVSIELYDDSINSYPLIRDFILQNERRISLSTNVGSAEIRIASEGSGYTPRPIY